MLSAAATAAAEGGEQTCILHPLISDSIAKDAILTWFRGEFAAANAIIDALCNHLTTLSSSSSPSSSSSSSSSSDYVSVFQAIHRRRLNWIPILHLQKYHSISDVALQLRRVLHFRSHPHGGAASPHAGVPQFEVSSLVTESALGPLSEKMDKICNDHETCAARGLQMNLSRRFVAKESVKGHMVNVLKGMKLHEDIFTDEEISKLASLANELRNAGRNGQLSGETFVLFNEQMKGNRREMIHLGVPLFQHIREEQTNGDDDEIANCGRIIEPIPTLLKSVIDHLVSWQLLPSHKVPNSCVISFFDEDEYSQPFLKPPHLDHPITTILLSHSTLAFGRSLASENNGNFKGLVTLSLKQGSLLVMRGNSIDMARHAVCSSPTRRASITFFKVREKAGSHNKPTSTAPPSLTRAISPCLPETTSDEAVDDSSSNSNSNSNNNSVIRSGGTNSSAMPKPYVLRPPPMMMLAAPLRPAVFDPRKMYKSGTGVFLPWRGPAKHLPPRAQKARIFALSSANERNPPSQTGIGTA